MTVAHVDYTGMCRKLHKKFGIYVAISTENKHNCIPIQCDAKQTNMNDETKK
jgi:hypothetical protein